MSTIPASAMPHAYADEGVDLRDPHGGSTQEPAAASTGIPTGVLVAGAALVGYLLFRIVR